MDTKKEDAKPEDKIKALEDRIKKLEDLTEKLKNFNDNQKRTGNEVYNSW